MESIRQEKEVLGSSGSHGSHSRSRLGYWLVVLATCCVVVGCTTLKKAGVTSLATGAAVTVATAGMKAESVILMKKLLLPITGTNFGYLCGIM